MTTSKVKTAQQKAYAEKREKLTELRKAANKAASEAARQWIADNPDYKDLAVKPLNISYIKNKKGMTKAIIEIAKRMTWPSNAQRKQIDIVRDVQEMFPELNLRPNIWQKALHPAVVKKVHEVVNGNIPKPINLKGCNTLSKIKKKIKTARDAAAGGPHTFKPVIKISGEAVVINSTSYPLIMRESKGQTYPCIRVSVKGKRCWVRMDGLVATLKKK